jgi:hypothetical protein
MKILEAIFKTTSTLHHAYFLVGDVDATIPKLISFLENSVGIKIAGNPDFWHRQFDAFTIEEARLLSDSQERKVFGGNPPSLRNSETMAGKAKIFIIQTNSITEQAQNALLKIFEEPTAGTHFFILMPQDTLLPTLRSRMQVILSERNFDKSELILNKSLAERVAMVKEITDGIKEAKSSQNGLIARSTESGFREEKNKQDAISLLNQIERELYEKDIQKSAQSLKICQSGRESLNDNGAPIKMILENLVISV